MPALTPIETYTLPTAGDLPENIAGWQIDPSRAVLLIHDMQRYFVRPFPAPVRDLLVHNIAELQRWGRATGLQVAYTLQPGGMTVSERGLLASIWGPGMSKDAVDREVLDEIAPQSGDWQFTKWRYSAFVRSDLLAQMTRAGRDQLVVCGVYAHVGVLMTIADAFQQDLQTFLVADATADFSASHHRLALDYAASRCAVVTTTKEVLS